MVVNVIGGIKIIKEKIISTGTLPGLTINSFEWELIMETLQEDGL